MLPLNCNQISNNIVGFAQYLRKAGYLIGISELSDSMKVITDMQQPDQKQIQHQLRSLYCRDKDEWLKFDDLFKDFWNRKKTQTDTTDIDTTSDSQNLQLYSGRISGIAGTTTNHFHVIDESQNKGVAGAGKQQTIAKADFRFLNNKHAMREAERLAEKLALQLKYKLRRRKKISGKGKKIDMRHTLRSNMRYGGALVKPKYNIQCKAPPHLVILHDVSHSMTWSNPLLFRFVRGLVKNFTESEAFVFHTRLYRVTGLYKERSIKQMREKLESKNNLWLGGTSIAESLKYFNRHFAKSVLRKNSIVMIISDGFDTDSPEELAKQLLIIREKVKQFLWLNPMLGRETYTADSATLLAAQPYIDHFAAAHSLDALKKVIYSIRT